MARDKVARKSGIMLVASRNDLKGMSARLLLLFSSLLAAFAVCLSVTLLTTQSETVDFSACCTAFGLILTTSLLSHLVGEFPRGDEHVLLRLCGTISVRSGLILLFLAVGGRSHLLHNGLIYYILAFYAIGLGTDILLTCLRLTNHSDPAPMMGQ
ncbi:MAG: hypothetical protein P8M80_04635 [Pirellulaceae bacterium]|nr:hypothetical protein [Pirellulaceae bacterium]